jgi:hypothetical protein
VDTSILSNNLESHNWQPLGLGIIDTKRITKITVCPEDQINYIDIENKSIDTVGSKQRFESQNLKWYIQRYSDNLIHFHQLNISERKYFVQISANTKKFLKQFLVMGKKCRYDMDGREELVQVWINDELKNRLGWEPVIGNDNKGLNWAMTYSVRDWLEFTTKRLMGSLAKGKALKIFNEPGVQEPQIYVGEALEEIVSLGGTDFSYKYTVGYFEAYAENFCVYEIAHLVFLPERYAQRLSE